VPRERKPPAARASSGAKDSAKRSPFPYLHGKIFAKQMFESAPKRNDQPCFKTKVVVELETPLCGVFSNTCTTKDFAKQNV
jgi:hypothetical protein